MLRCAVIGSRWSSDLPRDGTECLQEACHPVLSRSTLSPPGLVENWRLFVRPQPGRSPDQQAAVTAAGAGHIAKRIAMLNQIIR